jgi:hypothetical protein
MTMTRPVTPRLLGLIALGVLASPVVAGGCGGNSNVAAQKNNASGNSGSGGSTAGRGGASAGTSGSSTGGTSNRGGTGGKSARGGSTGMEDGGEAGASTGGTGGATSGAGGKPSGGSAGKSGAGGSAGGTGGQSGGTAGQSGGSAGQSGAAGNGAAGMVGGLGTPCSPPGALACAGNYQKLTVLCGGDGEWEANQTCGADLYCDSTPGPNVGTCRPVAAGCEGGPGTTFCDEQDPEQLLRCTADAVRTSVEPCDGLCRNGVCRDAEPCPVWSDYDDEVSCSSDCPAAHACAASSSACPSDFATVRLDTDSTAVLRTLWAEDTCQACNGTGAAIVDADVLSNSGRAIRVTVPAPWKYMLRRRLDCSEAVDGCVVLQASTASLRFVSSTAQDGPVNILFENVATSETCPAELDARHPSR